MISERLYMHMASKSEHKHRLACLFNNIMTFRFTAPECSPDAEVEEDEKDPEDVLSPASCFKALIQLRRIRFFVKKVLLL